MKSGRQTKPTHGDSVAFYNQPAFRVPNKIFVNELDYTRDGATAHTDDEVFMNESLRRRSPQQLRTGMSQE
jgi:hypothetical protein